MSYQGNTGDYGAYYKNKNKAEEKTRLAELKKQKDEGKQSVTKKSFDFSLSKFTMPQIKLPKIGKIDLSIPSIDISKLGTRRNGIYAAYGVGSILMGIGLAAFMHRNDPKITYTPIPKIDFNARMDSIKKIDQRAADSISISIAGDIGKTQHVLDSFYTVKLDALNKKDKMSDSAFNTMLAADETHDLFVKDSASLVGGHPGIIFAVDNGFLTAESKVRYTTRTIYTGKLTAQ